MGLKDALKRVLGREQATEQPQTRGARPAQEEEEPRVPEVSAQDLLAEMRETNEKRLLLDCREHYERAQAHIPGSLHIPMNSIPSRLSELDREKDIVVYCAHGNRSYGVAGWLNRQGYTARSLAGGIADWQLRGGQVESPHRKRA